MGNVITLKFKDFNNRESLTKLIGIRWAKIISKEDGVEIRPIHETTPAHQKENFFPIKAFIEDKCYRDLFLDMSNNHHEIMAKVLKKDPILAATNIVYHFQINDYPIERFQMADVCSSWAVIMASSAGRGMVIFDTTCENAVRRAGDIAAICYKSQNWKIVSSSPIKELPQTLELAIQESKPTKEDVPTSVPEHHEQFGPTKLFDLYTVEQVMKLVKVIRPDLKDDLSLIKNIMEN